MVTKKQRRSSTLEGSGWQWLPRDILDLILERLIEARHYIRFSVVCKHWRSIALPQLAKHKQHLLESCHRLPPLLMLVNKHDNGRRSVAVRSGTLDQPSRFKLKLNGFPLYDMTKDCDSSHVWLAYANVDFVVTLLNPCTGCTITLPPVPATEGHYIKKVVLSTDPSLCPNDFEVLVVYQLYCLDKYIKLAHFKSGQDAWTRVAHNNIGRLNSYVAYYRDKFLFCTTDHYYGDVRVFSVDVSSKETTQLLYCRVSESSESYVRRQDSRLYLVESSEGNLLMIRKVPSSEDPSVKVFKLSSDFDDVLRCTQIETIGNDALFLDRNQCICVSASKFPECHPNFIYFVEGTFDLKNQKLYRRYHTMETLSAVWISPTMSFEYRLLPTTTDECARNRHSKRMQSRKRKLLNSSNPCS